MNINKLVLFIINLIVGRGWSLVRLDTSVAEIPLITIFTFHKNEYEITLELYDYGKKLCKINVIITYLIDKDYGRYFVGDFKASLEDTNKIINDLESRIPIL